MTLLMGYYRPTIRPTIQNMHYRTYELYAVPRYSFQFTVTVSVYVAECFRNPSVAVTV